MTSLVAGVPAAPRSIVLLVAAVVLVGVPIGSVNEIALTLILYLPYVCVGALLAIRRPRNLIGWLLIGVGWAFVGGFAPMPATAESFRAGTASPLAVLIAWWSSWSWFAAFALVLVVMIIFPAGRLPTGRWRGPGAGAIVVATFAVVLIALAPTIDVHLRDGSGQTLTVASPLTFLPNEPPWSWLTGSQSLAVSLVLGLLIAGAGSMLVRVRRAEGLERQQLRWMVASLSAVTAALAFGVITSAVFGDAIPEILLLPEILAFALPAIAIGIAILRYRLYEIDRIISRTIGWAIVTGVLIAVFAAVVISLQAVLSDVTQGQTFAVAASTLVAFVLFQPVRWRVQGSVDRTFDRGRYDAERTVDAFAERVRNEVDLSHLRRALATTAGDAVRPSSAAVWLRSSVVARQ